MASEWRKQVGKVQKFVGKSMGGLSGTSNLAAWAVAGSLAWFLWVKPSQDLRKEQQERVVLAAMSMEKRNPVSNVQDLIGHRGEVRVRAGSDAWEK